MQIQREFFGKMADGTEVPCFTLVNGNGLTLKVIPYGCRFVQLLVKDRDGVQKNVVLGHDTLEEYLPEKDFHGALVGRYANRIGDAQFTLAGKTYRLAKNDGRNSLHGGAGSLHDVIWEVAALKEGEEPSITLAYRSEDGAGGYPGQLDLTVCYTLTKDDAVQIDYTAQTTKATPISLTNHSFFNLTGDFSKNILAHALWIDADNITAVTDDLIPTGELLPVADTPYDFRRAKPIGRDITEEDHMLQVCSGYDHNYALNGKGLRKIAELYDPASGRVMETYTDLPAVQLYTCNLPSEGVRYQGGAESIAHQAVCLETQYYPDSPNHPSFPFSFLLPGETYHTTTVYHFLTK